MHHYGFLVLLLCYNVICDQCVTYNFEENLDANFTNSHGICSGMSNWTIGKYASLSMDSPNRRSSRFLSPQSTLSCVSSFKFSVSSSGTLEVNVYMRPAVNTDQISVLAFQSIEGRPDATVGNAVLTPRDNNFVPGWQTLRVHIIGVGQNEGYITFLGMASAESVVAVDSFRYIPPSYDRESCKIYADEDTTTVTPTTTPSASTTTLTTSTTEQPSTTVSVTPTTTSAVTSTTSAVTSTTSAVTSTTSPTTERPRVSISILLIKINKFFK